VYGELIPTGKTSNKVQHTGLGKRLMAISENIAILSEYEKMAIISGVGVRGYYKKLGYKLYHTYLTKKIIVN
jgi:elongator complex protein 3